MRKVILFLFFPFLSAIVLAQNTNISGIINKYSKVTAIEYCGNRVIVDTPSLFQVGAQALIIQMQGVTIDQTNTSSYGNITSYGPAGNYEIQTIDSILGDTIKFRYQIQNAYDPSQSLQLIPLPVYQTATVNGVLTCKGWEGNTGGVLLLKTDTLVLSDTIDISGKGFRGFYENDSSQNCYGNLNGYFYTDSMHGAIKGEGIVEYPYFFGSGKNANGGGGGDNQNTGGGGGGNFGAGGLGGQIVYRTIVCQGTSPGVGGASLVYSNAQNKVFMGGGGGCGHGNNSEGTPATNGGGICLIIANVVVGNNQFILSNGIDQLNIAGSDGAGAAGAGGTVLLDVNQYSGNLSVIARGGIGGSLDNDQLTRSCMGPAGGGGGGILWVNQATVPANITFAAPGGPNGINLDLVSTLCAYGVSNGAMPGDTGGSVTGLAVPIPATPYVRLSATASNDTVLCNDQQITLTALGIASDSVYYIWSTGQQTPSVSFLATQTGPYSVTVSDKNTCTFVKQINVTVYVVSPNFSPSTSVCSPQNMSLSAQNPGTTAVTYAWSNGNNTPTISFFADSTTSYSVTVTSDSLSTCVAIDTIYIGVGTLSLTYSPALDTAVCPGSPVVLTIIDTSSGGLSYAWSTGATTQSITVSPTTNSTYDVTVSAGASCTSSHSFVVNMDFLGTFISADTTICPGGTADIIVNVPNVNNVSYHWSNGDSTQQISVSTTSTQSYTVTTSSTNGCTGTATVNVDIDSVIVTTIPAIDTICPGSTSVLSATVNGVGSGTSYLWSTGGATQSISVSPSGNQSYSVTATDSLGCTGIASVAVIPNNNATHLVLHITATPDSSAGPGDSIELSVTGARLMTFAWTPGEYLSDSTIQSPIATPLIATYYCVAATDSSLCTIEVCQEVKVGIPPARIAIPSAFSPNGDNKNDTYYILTSNGTIIASLKIYDRKGILIFDNTTGQSWDGTYRGAPQPQGTYVCFITYYQELYPDNLFYKEASFDLFR
jgi:gliding motility-associated-like protein